MPKDKKKEIDCKHLTDGGGCLKNKNSRGLLHGGCKVWWANQECDIIEPKVVE